MLILRKSNRGYKSERVSLSCDYLQSEVLRLSAMLTEKVLKSVEDKFAVKFKPFQREVCFKLFSGEDLFVVAPTGAGKTYCFIFLSELYKSLNPSGVAEPVTLVVSPLSGLMLDQSERCKKFGLKATFVGELQKDQEVKDNVCKGLYNVVFMTPESVVDSQWRKVLSSSAYQGRIKFVVIDETHCVSHWGDEFRPHYRRLGELRSFLPDDVQFLALTATATSKIKDDVCKSLLMNKPHMIKLPMDRTNNYYEVRVCKSGDFSDLKWYIDLLKKQQKKSPKAIVYCRNVKTVAQLFEFFSSELEERQFCDSVVKFENRLIAMFHRSTAEDNKNFVLKELKKTDSAVRIVIATSSFEMGLDFPDIKFVVNYAAPRSIESFTQQSGRAGRQIEQAFSLVIYQSANVGKGSTTPDMRNFLTTKSLCRRKILQSHFDIPSEKSDVIITTESCPPVGCQCCDICRESCSCGNCADLPWLAHANSTAVDSNDVDLCDNELNGDVEEQRTDLLKRNLDDYQTEVLCGLGLDQLEGNILSETFEVVIDRLLLSCSFIVSVEDVMSEINIYDVSVAQDLLELINEVFDNNGV